jgi:protein-S-isoprenylcysteine O-methyltransferase Ste14
MSGASSRGVIGSSWQRFAKDRPRVVDASVVLLLFAAAALGGTWTGTEPTGRQIASWPGVLLASVGALALLWHHAYPRTVVAVTAAASNAAGALGPSGGFPSGVVIVV